MAKVTIKQAANMEGVKNVSEYLKHNFYGVCKLLTYSLRQLLVLKKIIQILHSVLASRRGWVDRCMLGVKVVHIL